MSLDEEFEARVLDAKGVKVVVFFTPWCHASAKLSLKLSDTVFRYDLEISRKFGKLLDVKATPTLIRFMDGEEVDRKVGDLNEATLETWLTLLKET